MQCPGSERSSDSSASQKTLKGDFDEDGGAETRMKSFLISMSNRESRVPKKTDCSLMFGHIPRHTEVTCFYTSALGGSFGAALVYGSVSWDVFWKEVMNSIIQLIY